MHDVILFYSKSKDLTFNKQEVAPRDPARYEIGYHTVVDRGVRKLLVYDESKAKEKIKEAKKEGTTIAYTEATAPTMGNVWSDISIINPRSKERTGYPTQKPLALLHRIVEASSNEGDLVMDPFCGCATTCVAAQNMHRNWIGIDVSEVAAELVADRLSEEEGGQTKLFTNFDAISKAPTRTDLEKLTWSKEKIRQHFYGIQNGNCNGCGTHFDHAKHFHIDHIYPQSKGGAWHLENLQLLCGNCNSIKGDRPMEYLQSAIRQRKSQIKLF